MATAYDYLHLNDEFIEVFHTSITHFLLISTNAEKNFAWVMFSLFRFDEWLGTPDGVSIEEYVLSKYGERGRALLLRIIEII